MLAPVTQFPVRLAARFSRGVTLVEIMVAVAVLGVILAVAAPSLSDFLERRRIVAVANEVANVLHFARAEPVAVGGNSTVVVVFRRTATDKLSCIAVVTQSGTNKCRCDQTPVCPADAGEDGGSQLLRVYQQENALGVSFAASAAAWSVPKEMVTLLNRQVMMEGVKDLKVIVEGKRTRAKLHLEVNNLGRVRICSPDASMGGYPLCA